MTNQTNPDSCISVVTASLNQARFLPAAIESVISQPCPIALDYIIVDGGSTDGSLDILTQYEALLSCNPEGSTIPHVTFRWSSEPDNGTADAINKGISMARGSIVGMLNSDDVYEPHALSTVVDYFESHDDADAVYGHALYIDDEGAADSLYPTKIVDQNNILDGCFICQPATFLRMGTIQSMGPFRMDLISFDYEYWIRLLRNGCRMQHINQVLARSRNHPDTLRSRYRSRVIYEGLELTRVDSTYNRTWQLVYTAEQTIFGSCGRILRRVLGQAMTAIFIYAYSPLAMLFYRARRRLPINTEDRRPRHL